MDFLSQTAKEPKHEPPAPKGGPVEFHTTILEAGTTATGIKIPDEVIETLGAGKRPPIRVTINGATYPFPRPNASRNEFFLEAASLGLSFWPFITIP